MPDSPSTTNNDSLHQHFQDAVSYSLYCIQYKIIKAFTEYKLRDLFIDPIIIIDKIN